MRRSHFLIGGAWLLHAVAWFLPVHKDGVTFPDGLPGWEAFSVAALAAHDSMNAHDWWFAVLSTMSAATTPLFIIGSIWVVARGSSALRRTSAWIAASAFILNAQWCIYPMRNDLRVGYFLWWFSFLLLAMGLFDLSKRKEQSIPGK
jgi:hypothetical protein